MMLALLAAPLLCAVPALVHRPQGAVPVRYTLELVEPETPLVTIQLEVAGDADGQSEFSLAEGWAGISAAGRDLELVEARGAGGALESSRPESYAWQVRHAPGEALTLTFELHPTRHRANGGPPGYYQPILEPGILHLLGAQALPAPDHLAGDEARPITLAWRGFAEQGWRTATSFGSGPLVETTLALDTFRHALFVAGTLRLYEREVAGGVLGIGIFGQWNFRDEDFVALATRIVLLEREFFGEGERPYYFLDLLPVGSGTGSSWGGTGLTNSFALFMTPDNGLATDAGGGGVAWLLAHEHFHEWNGHVITLSQPEELAYWFSEGFTDFYTRRLLVRGGLLTPEQELASWNRKLAALQASPERHAPATRVRAAFWTERAVGELPYQRGDVLAFYADHAIRARSQGRQSLDDVLRTLVARAREGAGPFSSEQLLAVLGEFAGSEATALMCAWAQEGTEPELACAIPGLRLVRGELPSFDTGFDHEATLKSGVVTGVRAGGPAARAGLADGQRLVGWSVTHGDAFRPVELTLKDGAATRTVSYLPQGASVPGWRMERGE